MAFYARGLSSNDTVLELGCGTGRICLALAQRDLRVLGVDIAERMIEQARLKLAQYPPLVASRVQLIAADMLSLDLPARFRRVIVPFYTLNFLSRRTHRTEALRVAARHLAPGGLLMLHTIPVERLRMQKPVSERRDGADIRVDFDNGNRLEVTWAARVIDAGAQATRQRVIYRYSAADGRVLDESVEELVFAWISEREISAAAAKAGLRVTETRSGFQDAEAGQENVYVLAKPG